MNPKGSFELNPDLSAAAPHACVFGRAAPLEASVVLGGGVAQKTLVLGAANVLMWKAGVFLCNKLLCVHFLEVE